MFALSPPDTVVAGCGTEAEFMLGEAMTPEGFLIYSARNFRQLPLVGTKWPFKRVRDQSRWRL